MDLVRNSRRLVYLGRTPLRGTLANPTHLGCRFASWMKAKDPPGRPHTFNDTRDYVESASNAGPATGLPISGKVWAGRHLYGEKTATVVTICDSEYVENNVVIIEDNNGKRRIHLCPMVVGAHFNAFIPEVTEYMKDLQPNQIMIQTDPLRMKVIQPAYKALEIELASPANHAWDFTD
eukprot:Platyproteum_vivax@DN100_c0_g1_i1.p1